MIRFSFGRRSRRIWLIGIYAIVLMVIASGMLLGTAAFVDGSRSSLPTRLGEIADVLACGASLLAFIGTLIALQAFAVATGLPDLEIQIWFGTSPKNVISFHAVKVGAEFLNCSADRGQTVALITIRNKGVYPARNPAVLISLAHVTTSFEASSSSGPWSYIDWPSSSVGEREDVKVVWGGQDASIIHGGSALRLPSLKLGDLSHEVTRGVPELVAEILADGYRREVRLPIYFELEETASARDWRNVSSWI